MPSILIAYSGGLYTSVCVKYLSEEKGYEVHAAIVDTGGFSPEEMKRVETRAHALGAKSFTVLDEVKHYYESCIRYLVFGNVLKNRTYPLSVSAERVFQAMALVRHAQSLDVAAIAHGSTGAGNDQVRFDLIFQTLAPHLEIVTPIRDMSLSREEEIDFLRKHGVDFDFEKATYSINQGLWGTSVGGKETLNSWDHLPEEAYPTQLSAEGEREVHLDFEQGELWGVDGTRYAHPIEALRALGEIAGPYAGGRDIHVGDTIIGIKGRVGFEAAAPLITLKAHELLEKHTLGKWQQYWKEQLGNWYGMLLHEGQFLDPVMRDIEAFLTSTQAKVSGKVKVMLSPYRFVAAGVDSPHDLMSAKFGTYGEANRAWTGEDVRGFTTILANAGKIYHSVHQED
ncbi:MAG: argininosuccinate synthase domain-containing protein [Bacteroidota bacterium]